MNKQEAKKILHNWFVCQDIGESEDKDLECNHDCESCEYNVEYDQLVEAIPIAIECIDNYCSASSSCSYIMGGDNE